MAVGNGGALMMMIITIKNDYYYYNFLIVGGFYSEVALQKREAEGTVRTKHQLNLDPKRVNGHHSTM